MVSLIVTLGLFFRMILTQSEALWKWNYQKNFWSRTPPVLPDWKALFIQNSVFHRNRNPSLVSFSLFLQFRCCTNQEDFKIIFQKKEDIGVLSYVLILLVCGRLGFNSYFCRRRSTRYNRKRFRSSSMQKRSL